MQVEETSSSQDGGSRRDLLLCELRRQSDRFDKEVNRYRKLYRSAKWSWLLRAGIFAFFVFGAMAPLVKGFLDNWRGIDPLAVGYVSLVIASLGVVIDRVFMVSKGRLGFLLTLLELLFLKRSFEIDRARFEWLVIDDNAANELAEQIFEAARHVEVSRTKVIRAEVEEWRDEYQASFAELKAQISSTIQKSKIAVSDQESYKSRDASRISQKI